MKKHLLLLTLLLCAFGAVAQVSVNVSGVVTDTEKHPLENVTVSIAGQGMKTQTDGQGRYQIISSSISFNLRFNLLGYGVASRSIVAPRGAKIKRDIILKPRPNELGQVEIKNRRNKLDNAIAINSADLSSLPSVSGNFESVLKTLPGVSTNNELSAQYSVRGGNFDENLIYLNDVELVRPVLIRNAQQEGLSFINADLASRVRFSAGGFGARYGDKLSSVLDVRYDRPDSNSYTATAGFLGASLAAKTKQKNGFLLAGLRYKNNNSVLNTQDVVGSYRPNFWDAQLVYQYDFSKKISINAIGNFNRGQFNLVPEDRQTDFGTLQTQKRLQIDYDGQERDSYQTLGGAVTLQFSPKPNTVLKWINSYFDTKEKERFDIEGNYVFEDVHNDDGSGFGVVRSNRGIGVYYNYARNFLHSTQMASELKLEQNWGKHELSAGAKLEIAKYADAMNEYSFIDSAGYILPNQGFEIALNNIAVAQNLTLKNYSGFLQDAVSLNSNLDLQFGARVNYNDLTKQVLFSPRLMLAYTPKNNNKILRFTAGVYQQPPTYRSLRNYDGVLNLNQKAQRSFNTSLGYDYTFAGLGTQLKFTSEAYFKYSDRMVPYLVDNVRIRYLADQLAKGYTYGADFSIGGTFVRDLVSYFRLSLLKANQDIIGDSYTVKNADGSITTVTPGYLKRPTDQRVNVSVFFQDRLLNSPTYKVHLNLLYGSRLPVGSPFVTRYSDDFHVPAYRRVDIGFSKDFLDVNAHNKPQWLQRSFKSFIAYAEVFNLLNLDNTVSYLWIKDATNVSYAVPNYLTGRQVNLKLIAKF